ncbi:hypothetical protein D9758_007707 [Tetrapyrgos nigripes]|uniref:GATA-type domain-containing protein n=1 Tax=Tetrapyrgos nigripes TaxID=182062 RepID=A0A8H5G5D5_9AGAR|nr:hypothetical protein D9758_007707 [Tetrapyrgos nigripes]
MPANGPSDNCTNLLSWLLAILSVHSTSLKTARITSQQHSPMHSHPQHDSLFNNPIDSFTPQSYNKFSVMNDSNSSSEYWNYEDYPSSSSYSSSRGLPGWSQNTTAPLIPDVLNPPSSYPRTLPGFSEIRSTPAGTERRYSEPHIHYASSTHDMGHPSGMVWGGESASYHNSPHWTSSNLPRASNNSSTSSSTSVYDHSPSWNDTLLPNPEFDYDTKPIIRHRHNNSSHSCSPLSSFSSLSPSPSPPQALLSMPLPSSSFAHPSLSNPRASSRSRPSSSSGTTSSSHASRRHSVDVAPGTKMCSHCKATSTPLWRREPTTLKPLCNACGLYLQQRNKLRPQELIDADLDDESEDENSQSDNGKGGAGRPECSHCHTHNTSVWRRSKTGEQLCNACGVYSRLRGKDRPLSLKRNKIKPRTKHAKA